MPPSSSRKGARTDHEEGSRGYGAQFSGVGAGGTARSLRWRPRLHPGPAPPPGPYGDMRWSTAARASALNQTVRYPLLAARSADPPEQQATRRTLTVPRRRSGQPAADLQAADGGLPIPAQRPGQRAGVTLGSAPPRRIRQEQGTNSGRARRRRGGGTVVAAPRRARRRQRCSAAGGRRRTLCGTAGCHPQSSQAGSQLPARQVAAR